MRVFLGTKRGAQEGEEEITEARCRRQRVGGSSALGKKLITWRKTKELGFKLGKKKQCVKGGIPLKGAGNKRLGSYGNPRGRHSHTESSL